MSPPALGPPGGGPVPAARHGGRVLTVAAAAGVAGIAVLIAGTFLPWVRSGTVTRNLYTVAGVAARIGVFGPQSAAVTWLSMIGPLCILPLLLALLRLRRTAAAAGILVALATGAAAAMAIALTAGRSAAGVSLDVTGPVTVILGAALLLGGALCLLAAGRSGRAQTVERAHRVAAAGPAQNGPQAGPQNNPDRLAQKGTGAAGDPAH